jgi:hypothetical protein
VFVRFQDQCWWDVGDLVARQTVTSVMRDVLLAGWLAGWLASTNRPSKGQGLEKVYSTSCHSSWPISTTVGLLDGMYRKVLSRDLCFFRDAEKVPEFKSHLNQSTRTNCLAGGDDTVDLQKSS